MNSKRPLVVIQNNYSNKNSLTMIEDHKEELSDCCNAPVKRSFKLAGDKIYCTKCNNECGVNKEVINEKK